MAFISVGVGKCQSEDSLVCFGAKPTQRTSTQNFPFDRKRTRVGRPQSQEKEAEQRSGQNRAVNRSRGNWLLRMCGPGLANVIEWLSISGDFVGISLEYTLMIACRCTETCIKASQTSLFLRLELTQVHVCLFSFLPPSRLSMLCFVCP